MALTFSISMTLDGFITGPNPGPDAPLGEGGDRIHEWVYGAKSWRERHGREGGTEDESSDMVEEHWGAAAAILMGREMFDLGEPQWGEEPPFGVPVFVLKNRGRDPLPKRGGTTFDFVTGGIESALEQATAAAGDRDVAIAGGAVGDGVRLFSPPGAASVEIEPTRVIDTPASRT